MAEEERALKRLVKLSRWEQSRMTWGQQKMIPPLARMQHVVLRRLQSLEMERRKVRDDLDETFESPRNLAEKVHVAQVTTLWKRVTKLAENVVRINQENALLVANSAEKRALEECSIKLKNANILCESMYATQTHMGDF